MNSKFLPAPEKIFILSENTREKQTNCSSKSTINKYANSAKKVIIFFTLIVLIRNKLIKGSGKTFVFKTPISNSLCIAEETLKELNKIKIHEELIKTCQDLFHNVYTPMLEKTGEQILSIAFSEEERKSDKFTAFE